VFKVFAFLKRNAALLSHDEYRAGHIGYHSGHSRRMKGMRGYVVNVWSNAHLSGHLDDLAINPPAEFLDQWDGFPEVWFDSEETWRRSSEPEKTRATAEGLAIDPDRVPDDGPYLFDPVEGSDGGFRSNHLRVDEHVVVPLERPERKLTKLMHFMRRRPSQSDAAFREDVLHRYAPATARMPGLLGLTVNVRDPDIDAAIAGFYPADGWRFSPEGRAFRQAFADQWHASAELWFEDVAGFRRAHADPAVRAPLGALEARLFEAAWWVEVDESVIVMPNRDPAPAFYYR
jgi:hypothetical protein